MSSRLFSAIILAIKDDISTTPSVPRVPWKPWRAVFFVLIIYFAAQFLAGMLISAYPGLRGWSADRAMAWLNDSVGAQFVYVLLAEALTIGAVYWFLKRHKTGWAIIGLRRPRWNDVAYGLAAVIPYYLLYAATVGVISAVVPGLNVDQKQEIGFANVAGLLALSMTFISLVILPPLTEEIMVRGVLYSSLKKTLPAAWAVVVTSFIFAVAHLPMGGAAGPLYIAALDTFVLSLVLIYLREKTGGLWASITLHAIKNGVAFVALFILALR